MYEPQKPAIKSINLPAILNSITGGCGQKPGLKIQEDVHMYSYEEKIKAVKLLIKYDKCYAQVMRELGYLDRKSLTAWYKQYLSNGDLIKECERKAKFSEEEKYRAVNHYLEHGKCVRRTTRILGYPSRPTLDKWILELAPEQKKYCRSGNALIKYTREQKEAAVIALCSREKSAREVANEIGITCERLYSWKNQLLKKGWNRTMPKKDKVSPKVKTNISDDQAKLLLKEKDVLLKQVEELKKDIYHLQLERDILEKAAEIIKKDKGISIKTLSNSEKAMAINALRENFFKRFIDNS